MDIEPAANDPRVSKAMSLGTNAFPISDTSNLAERVSAAIQDRAAPISALLRLYWALDADRDGSSRTNALREQLRARIGAPARI